MAAAVRVNSSVGSLYYIPEDHDAVDQSLESYPRPESFRPRPRRHNSIRVAPLPEENPQIRQHEANSPLIRRLSNGRENAKRFLRSVIAPPDWPQGPESPEEAAVLELITGVRVPPRSVDRSRSSSSSSSGVHRQSPSGQQREAESPSSSGLRRQLSSRHRRETRPSPASRQASSSSNPSRGESSMSADVAASRRHTIVGAPVNAMLSRPGLADTIRTNSDMSTQSGSGDGSGPQIGFKNRIEDERPLASSNGVSVYISLAEPVLYLQGFEQNDANSRTTSMLRGSLLVRVTKPSKLKAISLKFRGRARTEWPEGIPPKKQDYHEEKTLITHGWPFFNATFDSAEFGPGTDIYRPIKGPSSAVTALQSTDGSGLGFDQFQRPVPPSSGVWGKNLKDHRRSLQLTPSRSFGKAEPGSNQSVAAKGYRTFLPGDYIYNFEYPIDCHLPESINVELGRVQYDLEVLIERAGAFRANILGSKEVLMVRVPGESSLEQVEPIAISRNWEDQLHYDIVISGKSFPLGSQIPIAFKLTPLAKVQCHRIKVYVTENIEYYCSNKRVHRMEPTRKIQLLEKRAELPSTSAYPGSDVRVISGGGVPYEKREIAASGTELVNAQSMNLLGDLDGEHNIGPTEMEMNVQLPSCSDLRSNLKAQRLHFDTTYSDIQVHHWIKIVMRLSKHDPADISRRRHFEISIDSPFHILSCKATQANTALPAYSDGAPPPASTSIAECGCPNSRQRRSPSLNPMVTEALSTPTRPAAAHDHDQLNEIQRPIHLLRNPSFNPPPFDADSAPPPLPTPPPQYDSIVGDGEGLADYFARLADSIADEEDDDREGVPRRMHLPLTPGGRVNRSMDERRTWAL